MLLTGPHLAAWAEEAGFHLYDQRIWHKDPCWKTTVGTPTPTGPWNEFEHVYIFWRPGVTEYDRDRLTPDEWSQWCSRGVWKYPPSDGTGRHEAEFPEELARRVIQLFSPPGASSWTPLSARAPPRPSQSRWAAGGSALRSIPRTQPWPVRGPHEP